MFRQTAQMTTMYVRATIHLPVVSWHVRCSCNLEGWVSILNELQPLGLKVKSSHVDWSAIKLET